MGCLVACFIVIPFVFMGIVLFTLSPIGLIAWLSLIIFSISLLPSQANKEKLQLFLKNDQKDEWIKEYANNFLRNGQSRTKYIKLHQKELNEAYCINKIRYDKEEKARQDFILRRKKLKAQGIPTCPHCGSEKIEIFTSLSNSVFGNYEHTHPKVICKLCGKLSNPGE